MENIHIIAIVGKSGCGKTTLERYMKKEMGTVPIVSYTTRPRRKGERNGREHYFVKDFPYRPDDENILAYTKFGGYDYWTTVDQVIKNPRRFTRHGLPRDFTYVIDEYGLIQLKKKFGERFDIMSVYIECPPERIKRWASSDRIERDNDRVHIDKNLYDCVLENNGTIEELCQELRNQSVLRYIKSLK